MAEGTNEMLIKLNGLIEQSKGIISSTIKSDVRKDMVSIVEGFFYSTILNNFKANLTEENLKEYSITKDDKREIEETFKENFEASKKTIKSKPNLGKIDSGVYQAFKKELEVISKNAYKFLLDVEEYVDYYACQKKVNDFKELVKKLSKEPKTNHSSTDAEDEVVVLRLEGD